MSQATDGYTIFLPSILHQTDSTAFTPATLLVAVEPGVDGPAAETLAQLFGATANGQLEGTGIYRWEFPVGTDLVAVQAAVQNDPAVRYAELDYEVQLFDVTAPAVTPNDPSFANQWALARIQAARAWDYTQSSNDVIIAIIDSGVDTTHPDLTNKLTPADTWYDFGDNDTDPRDTHGHGTHVAGIAAAASNNGVGISGLAWQARILPIKVIPDGKSAGSTFVIARGVLHAQLQGVDVINLSLGNSSHSQVLADAIAQAQNAGVIVVAAAGNNNSATPIYPAALDGVIGVAATDSSDAKANFSNYGRWVALSAPGDTILSTMPTYDVLLNQRQIPKNYATLNGTSMAAPHVAGLAALVVAQHPDWTPATVRQHLRSTADNIDSFNQRYLGQLGAGRINALAAVQTDDQPQPTATPAVPSPTATATASSTTVQFPTLTPTASATHTPPPNTPPPSVTQQPTPVSALWEDFSSAPLDSNKWDTALLQQGTIQNGVLYFDTTPNPTDWTADVIDSMLPGTESIQRIQFIVQVDSPPSVSTGYLGAFTVCSNSGWTTAYIGGSEGRLQLESARPGQNGGDVTQFRALADGFPHIIELTWSASMIAVSIDGQVQTTSVPYYGEPCWVNFGAGLGRNMQITGFLDEISVWTTGNGTLLPTAVPPTATPTVMPPTPTASPTWTLPPTATPTATATALPTAQPTATIDPAVALYEDFSISPLDANKWDTSELRYATVQNGVLYFNTPINPTGWASYIIDSMLPGTEAITRLQFTVQLDSAVDLNNGWLGSYTTCAGTGWTVAFVGGEEGRLQIESARPNSDSGQVYEFRRLDDGQPHVIDLNLNSGSIAVRIDGELQSTQVPYYGEPCWVNFGANMGRNMRVQGFLDNISVWTE